MKNFVDMSHTNLDKIFQFIITIFTSLHIGRFKIIINKIDIAYIIQYWYNLNNWEPICKCLHELNSMVYLF